MDRVTMCVVSSLVLAVAASRPAAAGECCDHCGGTCGVRTMCRLVCETAEVETECYGCACEDFCVPGPSHRGRCHCEQCCGEEGAEDGPDCGRPWCWIKWFDWCPSGACVHTRKVLKKYVMTTEVSAHHWEVEYVCDACRAAGRCQAAIPADEVPEALMQQDDTSPSDDPPPPLPHAMRRAPPR